MFLLLEWEFSEDDVSLVHCHGPCRWALPCLQTLGLVEVRLHKATGKVTMVSSHLSWTWVHWHTGLGCGPRCTLEGRRKQQLQVWTGLLVLRIAQPSNVLDAGSSGQAKWSHGEWTLSASVPQHFPLPWSCLTHTNQWQGPVTPVNRDVSQPWCLHLCPFSPPSHLFSWSPKKEEEEGGYLWVCQGDKRETSMLESY